MTRTIEAFYQSRYFRADEMSGDVTLQIESVEIENIGPPEKQEQKPVLRFVGASCGLVVNKTNYRILVRMYGTNDIDQWVGRRLTLYVADVQFRNDLVKAVRIRPEEPAQLTQSMQPASSVDVPF